VERPPLAVLPRVGVPRSLGPVSQSVLGTAAAHSRRRDGSIPSTATIARPIASSSHAPDSSSVEHQVVNLSVAGSNPAPTPHARCTRTRGLSVLAVPPVRRRSTAQETRSIRSFGANERWVQLPPPRPLSPPFRGFGTRHCEGRWRRFESSRWHVRLSYAAVWDGSGVQIRGAAFDSLAACNGRVV
jgi:hypothetical protein